jgi:Spy/CpxP family protein refolding chaperone
MHPAVIEWYKSRRMAECGGDAGGDQRAWAGCGPGGQGRADRSWGHHWRGAEQQAGGEGWGDGDGGGGFGVRRPLRFLAYKLELDEKQVGELARILDELKTERAQAEVDRRRTLAAFADAVGAATFDEGKAGEAGQRRVDSAQRLREAVTSALKQIHAVLDPEQRERLAYLIRTGTLVI